MVSYDRVCKVRKERYNKIKTGWWLRYPKPITSSCTKRTSLMWVDTQIRMKIEIARLTVLCYYSVPRQVEEGIQTNGGSGASLDHSSVRHRSPAPYPSSLVTSPAAGVPNTTIPPSPHCPTSHFPLPTSHSRVSKL